MPAAHSSDGRSADPPRVSILVPAGGNAALLGASLAALRRHALTDGLAEVVVVCGPALSPEDVLDAQSAAAEGVRWVRTPAELGLAAAANLARAHGRGELLVLLHDDTEVEPGWLGALLAAADAHPEAGAIGSQVLFFDGRLQNAGMILWRDGTTSPPWTDEARVEDFAVPRAVDYCGTSSLLVRAATWDAVGGLDERYFPLYYVDVDLAMAVRRHGELVLYEPRSRVRHHRGASAGSPRRRERMTARNRRLFLEKWGDDLERQEPRGEDREAAVGRAVARAAAGRRSPARPQPPRPEPLDPFDAAAQLRRRLEIERADSAAVEAELQEELAVAHAQVKSSQAETAELAFLRARSETLDRIERGRWWRIYQRLLPLLRLLGRG